MQRMGMVYALGQLGQPQDLPRAVHSIRYAADTADDNAPQGAYVRAVVYSRIASILISIRSMVCF